MKKQDLVKIIELMAQDFHNADEPGIEFVIPINADHEKFGHEIYICQSKVKSDYAEFALLVANMAHAIKGVTSGHKYSPNVFTPFERIDKSKSPEKVYFFGKCFYNTRLAHHLSADPKLANMNLPELQVISVYVSNPLLISDINDFMKLYESDSTIGLWHYHNSIYDVDDIVAFVRTQSTLVISDSKFAVLATNAIIKADEDDSVDVFNSRYSIYFEKIEEQD